MANYINNDIKKLRAETGAGILDCKKCLDKVRGDYEKAKKLVITQGLLKAEKKSDRETKEGYIASYVHSNSKVACLVEILCETDYVARNSEFRQLAKDVALQIAAMNPTTVEELLEQLFIKNSELTIEELVKRASGRIGEKLVINRFVRYEVGQKV